jgi:16S rRNA (cytosine967-C5)-methyltransferase
MTRVAAWAVLRSGSPTPLREVPRICAGRGLDERDTALVRRIVGTEVRHRGTLRAITRTFVRGKPKPDLIAFLHVGLVQLLYLDRVPDHAAVSETIGAVDETLGHSKVNLVNGVLRNVIRSRQEGASGDPRCDLVERSLHFARPVFRDPQAHPLLWAEDALSLPAALGKRWTKRWGRVETEALARTFLSIPPLVVRGIGIEATETRRLLEEAGVEPVEGARPELFRVDAAHTAAVTAAAAFREGRLTIQGETALAAARFLQAKDGERLLDLCAAPGGKTAVLTEAGAEVTAVDVSERRLELVCSTVERLGFAGKVRTVKSDGTASLEPGEFDGVLIDAPCSNSGVLGARPGARWRFGPETLRSLEVLQTRLLAEGAARVRPGGRLVWSTCSLEPEENARRVQAFLEAKPGWELEEELEARPGSAGGPGEKSPIDGGYAARLRRR